jgi:hypothetical protein
MNEKRNAYRLLVRKRPLERPRSEWILLRWILERLRCGGVDCIGLAQVREKWRAIVKAVMNLRVP